MPTRDDTCENMNFVFVVDDTFALSENVLKLFPVRNLTRPDQRIFNYKLSRARRVVENAFRILANRFRLFLTSINMFMPKIDIIVLCPTQLFTSKFPSIQYPITKESRHNGSA